MELVLTAVLALALGLAVGWLARGARAARESEAAASAAAAEREALVSAATADREALVRAEAELAAREQSSAEAANAFKALAGEALTQSSEQFLKLAETRLKTAQESSAQDLETRKKAIEELLKPLGEGLRKLDEHGRQLELKREKAYAEIRQQFETLAQTTQALSQSSHALATALKGSSQARGQWGEIALKRIVELAGMTEHCDFDEQVQTADGLRPDLLVRMPGGGAIPVDAKVPLEDYMKACETEDAAAREGHLKAHARALRGFVDSLRKKDYASQLEGPIDFTVLFVPTDAVLAAAFSAEPEIQAKALESRVLIATPVTLMALLRTVGIYWRHERLAESAEHMADAAHDLYDRTLVFRDHLERVGKGLGTAVDAFDKAVGSFERRVMPAGRKLDELGGRRGTTKALESPKPVGKSVRELAPGSRPEKAEDAGEHEAADPA
jgi:DNA recombination protein RmuC